MFSRPIAARYTPGVSWENPHGCVSREAPTPSPFWSSVSAAFTCPHSRRFKHGFLSSAWVTGVALFSVSAQRLRYIISGLHTLRLATPQRMPPPPRIVLLMGLFRRHVHSLKGALHKIRYGIPVSVCSCKTVPFTAMIVKGDVPLGAGNFSRLWPNEPVNIQIAPLTGVISTLPGSFGVPPAYTNFHSEPTVPSHILCTVKSIG